MLSGAANISRGWPAIQVLKLASDQKVNVKSPSEFIGDDVVLSALEHPPRIGEIRPIAALLPDVLARYGLTVTDAIEARSSIDVSV
jgi:hypothetical protein